MKAKAKQRGVFEKEPGSEIWWIRFADGSGRIRKEKAGTKSAAINLYQRRKTEVLQGKSFRKISALSPVSLISKRPY